MKRFFSPKCNDRTKATRSKRRDRRHSQCPADLSEGDAPEQHNQHQHGGRDGNQHDDLEKAGKESPQDKFSIREASQKQQDERLFVFFLRDRTRRIDGGQEQNQSQLKWCNDLEEDASESRHIPCRLDHLRPGDNKPCSAHQNENCNSIHRAKDVESRTTGRDRGFTREYGANKQVI